MKLALAFALALGVTGCSGGDPGGKHPLTLTLEFDRNGLAGCLNCVTLDDCALDCGGVVAVYLVDAESDEKLDEACIALPGLSGDTLRGLPAVLKDAELEGGVRVGRKVAVEIAVFSPSPFVSEPGADAGSVPICHRPVMGPDGLPVTDADSGMQYPSFWGRSADLTVRSGDNPITVSMSCVSDRPACATRPDALFRAQVIDMATQLPHPDEPLGLDVRFGHLISDGAGAAAFERLTLLSLPDPLPPPSTDPVWSKLVPNAFYDPTCLATRVIRVEPDTGPALVSCEGTEVIGSGSVPSQVTTMGYTIDKAFVDELLPRLGLSAIPAHGMIIGKVVDATGGSVGAAHVSPLLGDADVIYLDESAMPSGTLTETSASGWFVVKDPPRLPSLETLGLENCCQIFAAVHGGEIGCTAGPIGTINGTIMAARIVVDPANPNGCQSPP